MSVDIEKNKHCIEISVAKGILIILMVIGHSASPILLRDFIYQFHMPCFFLISGFLYKEKYLNDLKTYVIKKIKGLYLPFVEYSLLFLILHNLFYHLHLYNNYYTLADFKTKLFKIFTLTGSEQLLGGFWFLKELLYASIISILYFRLITYAGAKLNKINLLISVIFFVLTAYYISIAPFKIPTIGSATLLATAYFIAGYAIKGFSINRKYIFICGIAGYIGVFITSFFFCANMDIKGVAIFTYFTISIIGSISTIYISSIMGGWIGRTLDYIGKNTLYILTFHFLSFKIVSYAIIEANNLPISELSKFPIINNNPYSWIIYTIVGVMVPLIIKKGIEQTERFTMLLLSKKAIK